MKNIVLTNRSNCKNNVYEVKLNKAHIYTGINQLSRALSIILMIVLVPLFLSKAEQGYWFSFMSLSALMIIADSGFSIIILQFAAHEFAFLHFDEAGGLKGDAYHLKRLGSFFLFCLKWLAGVAVAALPLITAVGICVMSSRAAESNWLPPWLLYIFGSTIAFINNGLLFFFEGCDSVSKSQKLRAKVNIVMIAILCVSLSSGLKLYSLAVSVSISSLLGLILLCRAYGPAISSLLSNAKGFSHPWRKEFLPLLGRYSLSWASGYFIFQMYTPIMFHYAGPVEAGKIGISITLWSGVLSLSNIWLYVVTPKLNIHISKKKWFELDYLFFRNLILSGTTFLIGIAVIFSLLEFSKGHFSLADRFLNPVSMLILASGWCLQLIVNGLAIYLRAHKEEPLVVPSIVSAAYVIITTYFAARYLPPEYFFLGFLSSYLWGLPWIISIFNKKRLNGHRSEQQPLRSASQINPY